MIEYRMIVILSAAVLAASVISSIIGARKERFATFESDHKTERLGPAQQLELALERYIRRDVLRESALPPIIPPTPSTTNPVAVVPPADDLWGFSYGKPEECPCL